MKRLSARAAKSKSQAGSVKVVTVRISSGTTAVTGKAKIKTEQAGKEGRSVVPLFYIFQGQVSLGLRTTGSGSSRFSSP